jgi:hypothetical protein
MGSNHMISPVEKPMMRSMWVIDFVTGLISWQRQCPLVKRILVRWSACSGQQPHGIPEGKVLTIWGEDKSSHWKARFMFAKAK